MKHVIRHCSYMDRSKIITQQPWVRFLCDRCDCVWQANLDDYMAENLEGPKADYIGVKSKCPDCGRNVYRCFEVKRRVK